MVRSWVFLGCLLLVGVLPMSAVYAQDQGQAQELADLFVIYDVAEEAIGSSALAARQNAVDEAIKQAYDILINRIVAPESRSSIRRPTATELQRLLRGFEVEDERSSDGRYAARFHIAFDDDLMVDWLQASKVPFVMRGLGATMLYMVWTDDTGSHLYTEASDKLEMAATGWRNRIGLYRIPFGTLKDRLAMPISRILASDSLGALAHADTIKGNRAVFIFASEMDHDPSGLKAVAYRYQSVPDDVIGEFVIRQLPGEDLKAMKTRAFRRALDRLDDQSMALLQVGQGQEVLAEIRIDTLDIGTLPAFRHAISGLPMIDEFKILSVGMPVSVVEIEYSGRITLIIKALDQAGFDVWPSVDGGYRAKLRPAAVPRVRAVGSQ